MKYLFVLNDPPYGTERSYNGLRLALSLRKQEGSELRVFLMADAVACGKSGQKTPNGYYNLERMLKGLAVAKVPIGACGSCIDARGISESDLLDGVNRSSMEQLTEWTIWADKIIVF
ncbi:MAG: DsrE family protein [candidate division Zixibacteria bacterium]|nr:DsrE family protein [candidate division Zixibacteria bacterium]